MRANTVEPIQLHWISEWARSDLRTNQSVRNCKHVFEKCIKISDLVSHFRYQHHKRTHVHRHNESFCGHIHRNLCARIVIYRLTLYWFIAFLTATSFQCLLISRLTVTAVALPRIHSFHLYFGALIIFSLIAWFVQDFCSL